MARKWMRGVVAAVVVTSLVGVAGCSDGNGSGNGNGQGNGNGSGNGQDDGATHLQGDDIESRLAEYPLAELTDDEVAGLVWMREEEKLAHDVYVTLGGLYDINVFANISAAEQTHTDAVLAVLTRYGIDDPAAGLAAGEFLDPTLQSLYDDLVAAGSESLVAALTVGAEIEELDIVDLQVRATTTPDIAFVYDNLERGSRNHLRAFTKQLDRNGASYVPTHLPQAEYDAILAGAMEPGSGG